MRLQLTLSPNSEIVPFNHITALTGALHKWLGPNDEHGGLSLYSFGWLQGAIAKSGGLWYPNGATWHVSAINGDFLRRSIEGVFSDPDIRWGMKVTNAELLPFPKFNDGETYFRCLSPILVKRQIEDGNIKHFTFADPESDDLLTETMQHKLRAAGLPSQDIRLWFDHTYPKAKTQLVRYRNIDNRASYCPIYMRGTDLQKAFAWTVGIGSSTGVGFGAVWV